MARRLPSQQDTKAVERKIRSAFRAIYRVRTFETFFEHGQWWVRRSHRDGDDLWSVIDAVGYQTHNGFGFERI